MTKETFEEYIAELEDRKFNICSELVWNPFFMIKRKWILEAKLEQLNSDLKLANIYLKNHE